MVLIDHIEAAVAPNLTATSKKNARSPKNLVLECDQFKEDQP
jgi:hypothetical protein